MIGLDKLAINESNKYMKSLIKQKPELEYIVYFQIILGVDSKTSD